MQSKFPSEYFVFLKSVGLIHRVTATAQFVGALQCEPGSRCGRWGEPPGFLGFLTQPSPHPRFSLETLAICGVDAGRGRAKVEDLGRALRQGKVSRREFIKKTRVARKPERFLHPPSPHLRSAVTFPGPCVSCPQFPPRSLFSPPTPIFERDFL